MTNLWNKTDFNIGASLRRETFFFFLRKGRRRKEMGKRKKGRRKKRGEKLDRKKLILLVTNIYLTNFIRIRYDKLHFFLTEN